MGYPSASQRSDHGVSYKGLMPSEEILILEAWGRGKKPNTHLHGFWYGSYHLTVTKATSTSWNWMLTQRERAASCMRASELAAVRRSRRP